MRRKGIDTRFVINGAKYSSIPKYYNWDLKKNYPYYDEIEEVTFEQNDITSTKEGEIWLLQNYPKYYMGGCIYEEYVIEPPETEREPLDFLCLAVPSYYETVYKSTDRKFILNEIAKELGTEINWNKSAGESFVTFEAYLLKNKETEEFVIGPVLSKESVDEYDDLHQVCENIAKKLLNECKGQKKYTVRVNFEHKQADLKSNESNFNTNYSYNILSTEPCTYFWDLKISEMRTNILKKEKEAFDNGKFAIHSFAYGIKCDNEDCGWADWTVTEDQYPDYIDKPCPCCGENLLTREAFEKTGHFTELSNIINNWYMNLPSEAKQMFKNDYKCMAYNVKANGDLELDEIFENEI